MTTNAMGKLLDSYLTDLDGQPGFWRGVRNEVPVFVLQRRLARPHAASWRPIGVVEELDPDLLHVLLQANYDRALDARYAHARQRAVVGRGAPARDARAPTTCRACSTRS